MRLDVRLPAKIQKKEKWYTASCPALDVISQGETAFQARQNLCEALTLFFTSCLERNTLDAVLRQCGFISVSATEPEDQQKEEDFINIPLYFLTSKKAHNICPA
ncbi:MAG: hypothetical protein R2941_15755 [Desulfobacterales bacterium]